MGRWVCVVKSDLQRWCPGSGWGHARFALQAVQGLSQVNGGCDKVSPGGELGSAEVPQCDSSLPASRASQVAAGVSLVPTTTQDWGPAPRPPGENVIEVSWSILKIHAHFAFYVITYLLF